MTNPAVPDVLTIAAGGLFLDVVPEVGGSIAAFRGEREGRRIDWFRPASAAALAERNPREMASFPLVPFCNRIRDGAFTFEGTTVRLPRNYAKSRHPIHGNAWQQPWTVVEHAVASVTLALKYEPPRGWPDVWPFPYEARQTYALTPDALTVTMTVRNPGGRPMPLGFGHHPYYSRTPGMTIQARVSAIWSSDEDVMPTRLEHTAVVDRLADGLRAADAVLDNNFVGWDRTALIRWPEWQAGLRVTADEPLRFLVLYIPSDENLIALEAVSNCTDWLNLTHLGPDKVGGTVVAPGAEVTASFRVEPLW
ncbi:MAG TPA: aldose 1-epimerase [Azospirillaceae bacterium]|nr:aldose 1-epimerase [Azospirillaceae bacterium]